MSLRRRALLTTTLALPATTPARALSEIELKAELEALLLGLADDPAGQSALRAIGVERFVHIEDVAYDSVRVLNAELTGQTP